MKYQLNGHSIAICTSALIAAALAPTAQAIDVQAGDWKLSVSGNVNADYIYSSCESNPAAVTGGLACVRDVQGDGSSSVSNGLLPAALSISAATTQSGYDIGVTFGLYPGISTNDGGSPNIANTSTSRQHRAGKRQPRRPPGVPDLRQQGHGHDPRRAATSACSARTPS